MKILVLSDSHSTLTYMWQLIEKEAPDAVVHLGDHYDDGECIAMQYPNLILHQVAGNCDTYRCPPSARQMLCYPLGGVMTYMTHGHNHYVKMGLGSLLRDAQAMGAKLVLFGHTHKPFCEQIDGMWVLNPGSCGRGVKSAGIVEVDAGQILQCRLITI